jgi:Family of unknown function (DUF5947)
MERATPALASPRLRRLAQRAPRVAELSEDHCELCGNPLPPEHRHVLDLSERNLLCACRACSLLFDRSAAGGGHYRLVPQRRLRLDELAMPDELWERMRIPVDMAFFFHNSAERRVTAYYPSPMGPTESLLELGAWGELEGLNPVLATLEPDVEALLVNRARGARRQWLVPLEDCYALVAVIRTTWKGFSGGREVWEELARFWDGLDLKAKPAPAGAAKGE